MACVTLSLALGACNMQITVTQPILTKGSSRAAGFLCIWFIFDNEDADTDNDQQEADQQNDQTKELDTGFTMLPLFLLSVDVIRVVARHVRRPSEN